MSECMMFHKNWEKFIEDCSFNDREEFYTNGSDLVPVFRVEQMVEHYFAPDNNDGGKWIPVSEMHPEQYRTVLVWTRYKEMGEAMFVGEHFVWMDDDGVNAYAQTTHWMPLPNPPEEVNDD